jgi:hypothetical protein
MKPESLDQRLNDLLRAADRSFPTSATMPIRLPDIRARLARHAAWRAGAASIAAAIALFAVVAQPMLAPMPRAASPVGANELEIAMLEREATSIRCAALSALVERDLTQQDRTTKAVGSLEADSSAAAENAAFLLYCEADRLARHEETAAVARARYDAVANRFPGTIWARMASQRITTVPTEKG